jgi:hypothetical protein
VKPQDGSPQADSDGHSAAQSDQAADTASWKNRAHSLVPVLCASVSVRRPQNGVKSYLFANSDQFCGLFLRACLRGPKALKLHPVTGLKVLSICGA